MSESLKKWSRRSFVALATVAGLFGAVSPLLAQQIPGPGNRTCNYPPIPAWSCDRWCTCYTKVFSNYIEYGCRCDGVDHIEGIW